MCAIVFRSMSSLYESKITGQIIKQIDNEIKKDGCSKALQNLIKRVHSEMVVKNCCGEVKEVLEKKPTLIIANHPAEAEVLVLLAAIPKRKDIYLIANHSFMKILPSFDKHIIPVYIAHRINGAKKVDFLKYSLLKKIHDSESICQEEAHKKNIESIATAAKKVNEGALVIIFPGAGNKDGKFLSGIGHLIKNIQKCSEANLVMAHINGTSNWDYLRIIPGVGRLLPKFVVNFSVPIKINQIKLKDPKETANKLDKKYNTWVERLALG